MDNQAQAIARWAEQQPAESPSYTRVSIDERNKMLALHDAGLTLTEIAQQLKRSVSTVHEQITPYLPTLDRARRKLAGAAERMAENIIENGLPRDHIQALNGLGVLNQQDTGKTTVIINGLSIHGMGRDTPTFASHDVVDSEVIHSLTDDTGSDN